MHKNKYILLFLTFLHQNTSLCEKAFVAVPVTDLIGHSLTTKQHSIPYQTYDSLPLESKKGSFYCKRIHQLLFNETVDIIEETPTEVKIKIFNSFYVDKNGNPQTTYWARKKDFVTYDQLTKNNIETSIIPPSISYQTKNIEIANNTVITLTFPFHDKNSNETFSAGTRFIKAKKQDLNTYYNVILFDKKTFTCKKMTIPKKLCLENRTKNNHEKRKNFLNLIKQWAHMNNGFIPYVWGGCSFTHPCTNQNKIIEITCEEKNQKPAVIYMRKNFNHQPIPGLDCSGLVCRAAQICNIPYFYKNTSTIQKYLDKITDINKLQNGDLIVYNGHVMIVSDIKNNKIIEARTNEYGCGKIQEIPLNKAFQNFKTYADIFEYQKKNKPIFRMSKYNDNTQTIKNLTFRKLI